MITAANYLFLWSNSQCNLNIFKGGFNHFQALTEEQVYACPCRTIWKEPVPYRNIILRMGCFYQGRVRQKISSKQHNISGSHKWLTGAVLGGRHYYRNYYKELFCAVVQHRVETLTKNIKKWILNWKIYLQVLHKTQVLKNRRYYKRWYIQCFVF